MVNVFTVNEAFSSIEIFEIDAATEFLGIGSRSWMLFNGSNFILTVYFAARAKERRNEENYVSSMKNPSMNNNT